VEIFGGIGTCLVAVLEARITVRRYIHVDNGYVTKRAVRHHIQQLLLRYPAQLLASVILGCCGQLPQDVTIISDEDLRRLGYVDLIIAGWPCQGYSRADDPRFNLFADLIRLT
jgi:site-specific DNA-cytosine methylase